ncbi:hypothetical protein Tco_0765976 [Tanacetum coccineum]
MCFPCWTDIFAHRTVESLESGLVAVKYISDPIIPLCEVSFTGFPARSGPKLFGGTMGVFTEELSEILYFLITRPDPYSAATSFCGVLQIGIKSQACLSEVLPETMSYRLKEQPLLILCHHLTTESTLGYIPEFRSCRRSREDKRGGSEEDSSRLSADRGDDMEMKEAIFDMMMMMMQRRTLSSCQPCSFAERLLALPTPPPSPLSPYSSPLPQIPSPPLPIPSPPPNGPTYVKGSLGSRAAEIRQRDALPSPVHETEMPEICLPLRKRPRRTTPGPGYEVGESSAAGTARQVGPATAKADLYGFADMLDAAPRCQTSGELGYGITDTWDDLVGAIQEIAPTTLEGVNQRVTELTTTVDQEDEIIYYQLDDARHDRTLLRARVNMLYRDRPFHRHTALLMPEIPEEASSNS